MNGVKYYRIQKGLTQRELAQAAQIGIPTLRLLEAEKRHDCSAGLYRKIRNVLHVSIDELLRDDLPEIEDTIPPHQMYPVWRECPDNCIAVYRHAKRLTLRKLAGQMYISYETLRLACKEPESPERYVQWLADMEHMSVEEFLRFYGEKAS